MILEIRQVKIERGSSPEKFHRLRTYPNRICSAKIQPVWKISDLIGLESDLKSINLVSVAFLLNIQSFAKS